MKSDVNPLLIQTPQQRDFVTDGHLQHIVEPSHAEIASESCMPRLNHHSKNVSPVEKSTGSITSSIGRLSITPSSVSVSSPIKPEKEHTFSQTFANQVKDMTTINYALFTVFIVFILLQLMPPLAFLVNPKTQRRILWKVCVTSLVAGVIVYVLSLLRIL